MKSKPVAFPFRPPIIALVLLVISIILHYNFPFRRIIYYPSNLWGITGIILGIWITSMGLRSFRKEKNPHMPGVKPRKLVTSGPYRYTRNPMYLGLLIILLGIAILFGSVGAMLSPIAFFIIFNFIFIPIEEKLVESAFGEEYLDYKKRVRRWI